MDDALKLEVAGMKIEEALPLAVLNNKENIATKVDSCKQSDDGDGELDLWCDFAQKDVKP